MYAYVSFLYYYTRACAYAHTCEVWTPVLRYIVTNTVFAQYPCGFAPVTQIFEKFCKKRL